MTELGLIPLQSCPPIWFNSESVSRVPPAPMKRDRHVNATSVIKEHSDTNRLDWNPNLSVPVRPAGLTTSIQPPPANPHHLGHPKKPPFHRIAGTPNMPSDLHKHPAKKKSKNIF